ncbi:glycosyltransferase [Halobacillus litoralis]|uniref:glycosyltransferase n=1 Tax=Halobacillus litoralis TaxID=45668 RepID=UPI001CD4E240|nr:glycosyltransferase [Halobacillus litoralis]MCA0970450.1 glycosyltransferase [Halobacillus litoralis]
MISVVVCTKRPHLALDVIKRFKNQSIIEKELILILHTDGQLPNVQDALREYEYKLFNMNRSFSLGECLNFGIRQAKYPVVTKMDDDDYYGGSYLEESYYTLINQEADIVGKASFYIYFLERKELRHYNPVQQNRWVTRQGNQRYTARHFLSGATLTFRKNIIDVIPFSSLSQGEDSEFQMNCYYSGMKIYSSSAKNYVYKRYPERGHHTSDSLDSALRRRSRFIMYTADLTVSDQ